jgi:hypothetical protein
MEPETVEPQEPCQKCGKFGGHGVNFSYDGITRSMWICPHCLDALNDRLHLGQTHDRALRVLLHLAENGEHHTQLAAALELLQWNYNGRSGKLERKAES